MNDTETVLRVFYDKAYAAGVAAERERCAKVCDNLWKKVDVSTIKNLFSHGCAASAAAIRKGE